MADRRFVILTCVLAAGAAATLLLDRRGSGRDPRLGQPLLPSAAAAATDRVELTRSSTYTVLARDGDGVWHLHDPMGFPVDAKKVVRLLDDLGNAKFDMVAGSGKDSQDAFGLQLATEVVTYEHGKVASTFHFGSSRKAGGQYLTVGSDDKVYLTSASLAASPDADSWEMKTLVAVPKAQVQSIAFAPPPGSDKKGVTLARAKADAALTVVGLAAGEHESPAVKGADDLVQGIDFTKRYDAGNAEAKSALESGGTVVVTLFDGRTYDLRVGNLGDKQKKYFMQAHAARKGDAADKKTQDAVDAFDAWTAGQAFEVAAWTAQKLDKGRGDFVESDKAVGSR